LITGATGFLGRQVVAAFGRAGWSTVNTGFTRADAPRIYRLDLNDEAAVAQRLDEKL
jgi:S-adenosylmethionine synthetase